MRLGLGPIVLAAAVAGCVAMDQTIISGYPVGALAACSDGCVRERSTAVHWLDRTTPGHPPLDRVELHDGDYRTPAGSRLIATRSGGSMYVAVFVFADGTRGAVQVGCGIGVDSNPCFTSRPGIASEITIETP